ncbi:FliM/FliN family flagellar motor switch protein [Novosphingobium lentum]|uniref:FliM/FliN family flagellar motor switch protein n=1 Tax=Novosphingobium lentum TaxID=145287 RepID=UPI00082A9FFE|nr:FliM/FliN family flagellar motor switch protein [Novosphingobium lentum]
MKPERHFIAERAIAQHCAALLRPGPGPAELLPALARAGERLAHALRAALVPLLGGDPPAIDCSAPVEILYADFAATIAPLAANSLLVAGAQAAPLLTTVDAGAVLRLVDRAFGGPGEAPDPLPEEFPVSADLIVARLEAVIAARLAAALGADREGAIRSLRRDGSLAHLAPFAPATRLATIVLTISQPGRAPWTMALAFPLATLGELFGHGERPPAARLANQRAADPASAPFADMPLPMIALLVDMAMPLSAISALEPGQILPVSVARSVPLRIGDRAVARGTIGAVDDRVAVQITHIS